MIESRIVNGYRARRNQFPYQVSLLAAIEGGRFYVCGGSILSAQWILTAAHCTQPHQNFILRFGSISLWAGGQVRLVTSSSVINHPGYDQITLNNDIALIRLDEPLDLVNGELRAISLPGSALIDDLLVGNRSRVAGWGLDNTRKISPVLNFVDLQIIDNPGCRRVYGEDRVVDHVVCGIGYNHLNQATCGGDSGSALAVHDGSQWVQVGVASFGALDACTRGLPSGFMRVTSFLDWIQDNTSGSLSS